MADVNDVKAKLAELKDVTVEINNAEAKKDKIRDELAELMGAANLSEAQLPQFDTLGHPLPAITATYKGGTTSSMNSTAIEPLLTEAERKKFTVFSISIEKFNKALGDGTISVEDQDRVAKMRACISTTPTGKKLVVKNLPS